MSARVAHRFGVSRQLQQLQHGQKQQCSAAASIWTARHGKKNSAMLGALR